MERPYSSAGGLEQLDNLCKLMEELAQLKEQNERLKRSAEDDEGKQEEGASKKMDTSYETFFPHKWDVLLDSIEGPHLSRRRKFSKEVKDSPQPRNEADLDGNLPLLPEPRAFAFRPIPTPEVPSPAGTPTAAGEER